MINPSLKIENISELITVSGENGKRRGKAQGEIDRIKNGLVLVVGDKIAYAGPADKAPAYELADDAVVIDATGKTVTPGLIDSRL